MVYLVEDLYREYADELGLKLFAGQEGLKRKITVPEAQRPGLSLAGHLNNHAVKRIVAIGRVEIEFLRTLKPLTRKRRLQAILTQQTPAVIVARGYRPPGELIELADKNKLPLFVASVTTMHLLTRLTILLAEKFAPQASMHGTLVEVFGVGVFIQGDSSVGKSEAALGLVERGHRLVSDDIVRVRKCEGGYLEGRGAELTRYHMEIRGIGIINVAHLYGAVCVRDCKSIDLVVKLVIWDDNTFYDRVGIDDNFCEILGAKIPHHVLPVRPGRDVVLLLETIALTHRLKDMGYNSAQEFNAKLLEAIALKQKAGSV